jgi:hypothetical protein
MMTLSNMMIRVPNTRFTCDSHSEVIPTGSTSVRTPSTRTLRARSLDRLLKTQQQTGEYKRTQQVPPHQAWR